ncbi:hypothetical protein HMPREF1366_01829 [Enterococcus faecium ERV26]|nr:hypothetical protein HMPREF9522_02686 [Enterococcus faecium TX0082]EJX39657.1 hypothetical protein HMPREF1381_02295 [Enterococcus faecium R501]EJX82888.1 hypothetical protein HMPREF1368_02408 [Enterococcus faecium ERV69]EJX89964.1 hypothetical protein HMPREF1367_01415 [Enterococcus faecium ERV38]EJX92514.1 hypothetical protein HMPREF1366_01829 [Enterococcus faecium ERV26]EJY05873.1 hypothetical protein HMPREF1361_02563 [Enterococcus faecium ERV1]EJY11926.1 hypothetical protein HMPREF1359_0
MWITLLDKLDHFDGSLMWFVFFSVLLLVTGIFEVSLSIQDIKL